MNLFLDQFAENIKGTYSCFDRVILRGYILPFFSIGAVVNFLRALGFRKISNGVMRIFTDQLNAHIEKEASKHDIPILWWPKVDGGKNGAKLAYVEKRYASKITRKLRNHVYCILTDCERTRTFITRELISKSGKPYEKMYQGNKPVKHFYIYFHDQLLGGPCYLKLSSYFPFYAEFYFNGHNAIRLELDRQGLGYRMQENAFVELEDIKAAQKMAWSLSGRQVQSRIDYWMNRFFRFNKGRYSTCPKDLRHSWYCTQVEASTNVLFKSAKFCTSLFERLLDKFSRIGLPDSLTRIFGKRRKPPTTSSASRLYKTQACAKHWFRGNSIKQYNKNGSLIRTETTINRPKSLGLEKPVINLRGYLSFGVKCNERLLNCNADVDLGTIDDGELERLNESVETEKGQKIAAIDLRKQRQVALFRELLRAKYSVAGFRTRDLLENLGEYFRNSSQIRYEMTKLRARGLLVKVKGKSLWMVTKQGYQVLWVKLAANLLFENPLTVVGCRKSPQGKVSQPSKMEESYALLDRGLSLLTRELSVKRAS